MINLESISAIFILHTIHSPYELGLQLNNMLPQSYKSVDKPAFKKASIVCFLNYVFIMYKILLHNELLARLSNLGYIRRVLFINVLFGISTLSNYYKLVIMLLTSYSYVAYMLTQ